MHEKQWFLNHIGKTIKRERTDLDTGEVAVSYRFIVGEKEAIDCFYTQDKYNTYSEKEKPVMHGYKRNDKIDFYSNAL
jgi:hypothetical protein